MQICNECVDGLIRERMHETPEKRHQRTTATSGFDLLDFVFQSAQENDSGMPPLEFVRDQIFGFILAGQDTTSVALTFALYNAATKPDVLAQLRREADEAKSVADLVLLDAFLHESMRLYPAAFIFTRRVSKEIDIGDGLVLPEGVCELISLQLVLCRDC